MLRWVVFVLLLASSSVAVAQQQPAYVPLTIDEKTYHNLMNALADIKYRDSANIIAMFLQMEQKAQADAARRNLNEDKTDQ